MRHVRENEARLFYLNIKCGSYATDEIMDGNTHTG